MTTMNTPLPTPAAEAADSQPSTDGPMGLAAVPGYLVEEIVNGYVLTHGDGGKVFFKDIPELMELFTRELHAWVKDMHRHDWDGRFTLSFGFKQDNENGPSTGATE
jgi:hypothetical protein